MDTLTGGLELLDSAVSYTLASAATATTDVLLSRPTPCSDWDLETRLAHVCDSIEVVNTAIAGRQVAPVPAPGHLGAQTGPATALRCHAARLLATCATAGPGERVVAIADRELNVSTLAVAGAIEITVHGWDIAAACGTGRPIPSGLAELLLPLAPLIIPAGIRPGLFADPVRLRAPACPGDRLVAFLGRKPGFTQRRGIA
jgi:uncharacterized protein (TIGR03086 family)